MKKSLLLLSIVFFFSCSQDDDPVSTSFSLKTNVSPSESGTVSPASGNYNLGEEITLTAIPTTGYVFKNWAGVGVTGTENPFTITMNSDKNITAVFEAGEPELAGEIVGKWIINNSSSTQAYQKIQTQGITEDCYLFSLVFNSDGTFIISHRGGEVTGVYNFTGHNTISLGAAGKLIITEFNTTTITFEIELAGICSWEGQAILDNTYEEGSCVSFLNCQDGTIWKDQSDVSAEFVRFTNNLSGIWFEHYIYNLEENCRSSVLTNQNAEGPILLMRNNPSELIFVQQSNSEEMMVSYNFDNSGKLIETSQTSGVTTKIFEASNAEELNSYSNFGDCPAKTYVPDDHFEQELINRGYDDVMDDYVLTENIISVTRLIFYTNDFGENIDMTGLEDFVALKELEIWSYNFTEIDLSGNINLERLVLGADNLASLDLINNKKLVSIYIEFADFSSVDLSQNTELRNLEFHQMAISSIDISKNLKMEMLTIEGGNLSSVTSGTNVNLWHLNLDNHSLGNFDASRFPNMEELILQDNEIKSLDLTGLTKLTLLQVDGNELEALDISHLTNLRDFMANDNPFLNCIQVSQEQLDKIAASENNAYNWGKDPSAEFSLDCGN